MLKLVEIDLKTGDRLLVKNGISSTVLPGQCIAFLGRNGTGKTTLLKTIAGHLMNQEHQIEYNSIRTNTLSARQKSKLFTYISTRESIHQAVSVEEYLLSARLGFTNGTGLYSSTDYDLVNSWVQKLELHSFLNRNFLSLSDGEKQKVSVARAFIYDTNVLLFDEPTSSLDLPNKKIISQLLHQLAAEQNKIIIYSTHDYFTIKDLAQQVWFISSQGEFLSGTFESLQNEIEKDFGL